jgi:hypothetical protein
MNFLLKLRELNQLDDSYNLKSKECKKPRKINRRKHSKVNDYKQIKNEIIEYYKLINELDELKFENPIVIKMIDKLKFYGYSETMAKQRINELDNIMNEFILKDLKYLINNLNVNIETIKDIKYMLICYHLGQKLYDLLGLISNEIKEYFDYKWSCAI